MKSMTTIEMKNVASKNASEIISLNSILSDIGAAICNSKFAIALASILSLMLNEKVSATRALHLRNAFTAGTCAVLFGGFCGLSQFLLLAWLGIAIWQFRKAK